MSRSSEKPRLVHKLALVAVATLIGLFLAEGAVRLTGIVSSRRGAAWYAGGNHPRFLFQPDPRLGYRLRPDFHGRDVALSGEFEVPVETDALGLRPHAGRRPPGGGVLALGDSLTFGEGVSAGETYSAHLEDTLGVSVADAGVPGYSSCQAALLAEELLPRLRPRVVLITFEALWDEQRCIEPFVYKEGYIVGSRYAHRLHLVGDNLVLEQIDAPVLGPLSVALMRHSHLLRLALPAVRHALVGGGSGGGPPDDATWTPCLKALSEARKRIESSDAKLLIVLAESPEPETRAATEQVDAALTSANLPHVLLDELLGGADPALRYPKDHHWNRTGQARVAEALAPVVRRLLDEVRASSARRPAGGDTAPRGPAASR